MVGAVVTTCCTSEVGGATVDIEGCLGGTRPLAGGWKVLKNVCIKLRNCGILSRDETIFTLLRNA